MLILSPTNFGLKAEPEEAPKRIGISGCLKFNSKKDSNALVDGFNETTTFNLLVARPKETAQIPRCSPCDFSLWMGQNSISSVCEVKR